MRKTINFYVSLKRIYIISFNNDKLLNKSNGDKHEMRILKINQN